MEAIAQTQVIDSQGNLVLVSKPLEAPAVFSSPRSRRAPDSPTVIPPELADKDPLALKLESALKRSIADRTGDLKLKQEAAFQQSLADKMGARAVMSKEQLERTKKEAEQLRLDAAAKQSTADRTGDIALKKEAAAQQHLADKLIASANKSLAALTASTELAKASPTLVAFSNGTSAPVLTSSAPVLTLTPTTTDEEPPLIVQVLQDALDALLENAAQKQSQADRTGDLKLKSEAAVAQSKVDKMRAQLTNELKRSTPLTSPTLPTPQLTVVIPKQAESPRFTQPSSPLRSPQHPRAPPADLSFTVTASAPEKYKPPAQRLQAQQQQAVRQRSPQLSQFTAAAAADKTTKEDKAAKKEDKTTKKEGKTKKEDKNNSDKPADRTSSKSWRRRESYTPSPPSPSIPSNENKQPNKTKQATETKDLKPLPIKTAKPKMDATTNCSEDEFDLQA